MICQPCRQGGPHHSECRGGTWCDCQHRPRVVERYEMPGHYAPIILMVDVPALLR